MNKEKSIETAKKVGQFLLSGLNFILDGDLALYVWGRIYKTLSRISEAALMLSALWEVAHYVQPAFFDTLVTNQLSATLSSLSVIAQSVIPEIIWVSGVIIVIEHIVLSVLKKKIYRAIEIIWAVLFAIPTSLFIYMTYVTVIAYAMHHGSFLNSEIEADTTTMVIRVTSSLSYGALSLLYWRLKDRNFVQEAKQKIESQETEPKPVQKATKITPIEKPKATRKSETKVSEVGQEQKLIESPKDKTGTEQSEEAEMKVLSFDELKGQAKVNACLLSLSEEDQIYYWNNRKELSEKINVSVKTIERSYAAVCPDSKQVRKEA